MNPYNPAGNEWPAARYGPDGQSGIFNSAEEVPAGWRDHPSKAEKAAGAESGTRTAVTSPNGPKTTVKEAAQTTAAKSQTHTDPAKSAESGVGGAGNSAAAGATAPDAGKTETGKPDADKIELDADGHPWSAELHAASKSKTKAGLWRMAVGKSRPAPMPGYPLDL